MEQKVYLDEKVREILEELGKAIGEIADDVKGIRNELEKIRKAERS